MRVSVFLIKISIVLIVTAVMEVMMIVTMIRNGCGINYLGILKYIIPGVTVKALLGFIDKSRGKQE